MFATGWALKRLYKFVLKRLLGRALKNELDLEQLDVQLGSGTVELRNLVLDCTYLSDQLAPLPVMVLAGEVGRARAVIPWKALGSESCSIQLDHLEITLAPRPAKQTQDSTADCARTDEVAGEAAAYVGADDGIQVIAMLVEKVLLKIHVRVADLKVYLDGPAAINVDGVEDGCGNGCGQDGAPPNARIVPSVLIRADTLGYRDTSPAAERARSNQAPPPYANPAATSASLPPLQPELKAKCVEFTGLVVEVGQQVVADVQEEKVHAAASEDCHSAASSDTWHSLIGGESEAGLSGELHLLLRYTQGPLEMPQVAVNVNLGVVHSSFTPQGMGILSKVVHSFVYAEAEETWQEDLKADHCASVVECPEVGGRLDEAPAVGTATFTGWGVRNLITNLFAAEGATTAGDAMPWILGKSQASGGSNSLASSETSQGDAPIGEDSLGPSEAAVDLAASVDQFFDCCEGSQVLASSVLSSSMVSAKGVLESSDMHSSAPIRDEPLELNQSDSPTWGWASAAWASMQASGLVVKQPPPPAPPRLQCTVKGQIAGVVMTLPLVPAEEDAAVCGWTEEDHLRLELTGATVQAEVLQAAHVFVAEVVRVEMALCTSNRSTAFGPDKMALLREALPAWPGGVGDPPFQPVEGVANRHILRTPLLSIAPVPCGAERRSRCLSLSVNVAVESDNPDRTNSLQAAAGLQVSVHLAPFHACVDVASFPSLASLALQFSEVCVWEAPWQTSDPPAPEHQHDLPLPHASRPFLLPAQTGSATPATIPPSPNGSSRTPLVRMELTCAYARTVVGFPWEAGGSYICMELMGAEHARVPAQTTRRCAANQDTLLSNLAWEVGRDWSAACVRLLGVRAHLLGGVLGSDCTAAEERAPRPRLLPVHQLLDCAPPGGWSCPAAYAAGTSFLSLQWSTSQAASDGGPSAWATTTATTATTTTANTSASPEKLSPVQQLTRACRAVAARSAPRQSESPPEDCPSSQDDLLAQLLESAGSRIELTLPPLHLDLGRGLHGAAVNMVQHAGAYIGTGTWAGDDESASLQSTQPGVSSWSVTCPSVHCSMAPPPRPPPEVPLHLPPGSVPAAPALQLLQVHLHDVALAQFQPSDSAAEDGSPGVYVHLAARGCQVAGCGGTEAGLHELLRCAELDESSDSNRGVTVDVVAKPTAQSTAENIDGIKTFVVVDCFDMALGTVDGDLSLAWMGDLVRSFQINSNASNHAQDSLAGCPAPSSSTTRAAVCARHACLLHTPSTQPQRSADKSENPKGRSIHRASGADNPADESPPRTCVAGLLTAGKLEVHVEVKVTSGSQREGAATGAAPSTTSASGSAPGASGAQGSFPAGSTAAWAPCTSKTCTAVTAADVHLFVSAALQAPSRERQHPNPRLRQALLELPQLPACARQLRDSGFEWVARETLLGVKVHADAPACCTNTMQVNVSISDLLVESTPESFQALSQLLELCFTPQEEQPLLGEEGGRYALEGDFSGDARNPVQPTDLAGQAGSVAAALSGPGLVHAGVQVSSQRSPRWDPVLVERPPQMMQGSPKKDLSAPEVIEDFIPDSMHGASQGCEAQGGRSTRAARDDYTAQWYGGGPDISGLIRNDHVGAVPDGPEDDFPLQDNHRDKTRLPPASSAVMVRGRRATWRLKSSAASGFANERDERADPATGQARLQLRLERVELQQTVFELGHHHASRWTLGVGDFVVADLRAGAAFARVVAHYSHRGAPRESGSEMARLELEAVRPDPAVVLAEELRLRVHVLPLRLCLDQHNLDFLASFFAAAPPEDDTVVAQMCGPDQCPAARATSNNATCDADGVGRASNREELPLESLVYFQRCEVRQGRVRVDYRPRHVDYAAIYQGNYAELVNLIPWDGITLKLKPVVATGVHGWAGVASAVCGEWLEDVTTNQRHKFVQGMAPVKSLCSLGKGAAQLIQQPYQQYRRDGRLLRGVRKGAEIFLRSVTLEALGLGVQVAGGAHHVLERAEVALQSSAKGGTSHLGSCRSNPNTEAIERSLSEAHAEEAVVDLYEQEEPCGTKEGLARAAATLSKGLGSGAAALVRDPMKAYKRGASPGTIFVSALKSVPRAAVTPATAVASAVKQTLVGVRNGINPEKL